MEPKYLVAPDNILDPDGGVMFVKGQEVAVSDPDTEALRRKQGFVDAGTIEPTWKDTVSHIAEKVARGEAGELFEDPTGESSTPAYIAKSAVQGAADSVVHGLTGLEKGIVGGTLDLASAGARVLGGDKLADQLQDAKRFNEQMMDTKAADDLLLGGAFDNSREAWEKVMGVSEGLGQIAGGVAAAKPLAAGLKAAKVAKTAEGAMKGAFTVQMAAGGEEGARAQVLQGEDRDLTWREKAEVGYHTLKEGITAQFFGRLVGAWGKKIGNAGAAALEFGGINAAGVLADAYIGDNIAGRPWREIDEKGNSRLMTGNEKDWAVLQKAGAEFLYGGMQSLLMSMGGGIAGKKPAEVAANREKVVREPPPVVAEGANGEKVLEGGALVRTAEDGAVELVTPDGVVLDADGKVKTVAAGNVGQTGDNSYGIAIATRTNPLTGRPTAARETVRNALVALQEGVTADQLREIDGWTPENKAVFETVARLKQGLTDGMPAGELVDALASLGIGEAEARAFGFIPDGNRYVADALAVANNGTRQLANAVSNGGPGHIPLEIAAEVARSVNAGTTGLMPKELGKRQLEVARQLMAERAKATLEESAAGHGNTPEAERKVLDTPVENEDGTLTTLGEMAGTAKTTETTETGNLPEVSEVPEVSAVVPLPPGTSNTLRARHEREQSVRALGLKPLGDGSYGVARLPGLRAYPTDGVADDSGRPVSAILVTGLDPAEMLRPENMLEVARVLGDLFERCRERKVAVDYDPKIEDAVSEVMALWEKAVRQDPVLRARSEVVTSLLEKSGLASGIVTDQAAFEAALRAAGGEKAEKLIVDGLTYGFTDGEHVYLNPAFFGTKVGLNTPIHEFGHLGIIACKKINRPLYDRGVELIKQTDYWKEVTEHPYYKNDTPQKNAEEALTRLIADRGEKLAAETPKGVLAEIKQWLVEFWKTFGDALGLRDITPEQVEKMTVEQIADAIRAEMLRGERFGTSRAQVEAQQQSGRRLKADARKRSPQAYIEAGGGKASKAFAFWAANGKRIMNVPKPGEFGWDIYQQLVLGVKEPTERARIKRLLCGENVKNTRRKGNDEILAEFNRTMGGEGDIYTDESGYQQMIEEFLASHADYERWRAEGALSSEELRVKSEELRAQKEGLRANGEEETIHSSLSTLHSFDPAELEEWSRMYDESRQAMAEAGLADEPDARVPDDAMWSRGGKLRFSIGGKAGAANLGIGKNADAERMEKEGASCEEIWRKTGWWRGKDGRWRMEIPDVRRKGWHGDPEERHFTGGGEDFYRYKLTELIEDGDFLKAYPQARKIKIEFHKNMPANVGGNFDEATLTIKLPQKCQILTDYAKHGLGEGKAASLNAAGRKTIVHELQHAIQLFETFAKGGNPTEPVRPYQVDMDTGVAISTFAEELGWDVTNERDLPRIAQRMAEAAKRDQGLATQREISTLEKAAKGAGKTPQELAEAANRLIESHYETPVGQYFKLEGEVEARNVQARLGMTAEERAATPPWATEDVPEDRQIIRFSRGGVPMQVGTAPNGRKSNLDERQWREVRTQNFANFFGDWEHEARGMAIKSQKPVVVTTRPEGVSAKDAYAQLEDGENIHDRRKVRFVRSTLGKILRHKGYPVERIVHQLKDIYDNAVPIGFQEEKVREGHKKHPNFVGYHNYVGKIADGGKEYYVRITVQEERTRSKTYNPNSVHSTFVSDVELYKESDLLAVASDRGALSRSTTSVGERERGPVTDKILADFLTRGNQDSVSKIVDENGEPLVVYRGASFDPLAQEAGKGVVKPEAYFTADPEYAKRYAGSEGTVRAYYLNIRHPFDIRDPECLKDLKSIYPDHEFARGKSGALDWAEASIVDGEFLKENFGDKYDGIIYDEGGDPSEGGPTHRGISYVPLNGGAQVKSATDNIGTFDGGNPDVRFSRGSVPKDEAEKKFTAAVGALTAGKGSGRISAVDQKRLTAVMRGLGTGELKHPRFTKEEAAASEGTKHERLWSYILSLESSEVHAGRGASVDGISREHDPQGSDGLGRLRRLATRYGSDPQEVIGSGHRYFDRGAESFVYATGGNTVIKVRKLQAYNLDGVKEALAKIVYHNYLFPKDAYTLRDIAVWNNNGYDLYYLVLEQPLVTPKTDAEGHIIAPSEGQIFEALNKTRQRFRIWDEAWSQQGADDFGDTDGSDTSSADFVPSARKIAYNSQFMVYDFKPGRNTFIDAETGEVRFIDPRVDINDPGAGFSVSRFGKRKIDNRPMSFEDSPSGDMGGLRFSRGGYKSGDWRKTFTFGKAARSETERTPGGEAAGEERRRWEENPTDERIPEWDAPGRNPNIAKPFALSAAEGYRILKALGGEFRKTAALKDVLGVIDASDEAAIREDLRGMGFFKGDDILWAATATPAEVAADRADSQAALDARLEKLGEQRLKGEAGGGNRGAVRVMMSQVADLALKLPAETGGNLGNVRTLAQGIVRGFERERDAGQMAYYLQEAKQLIDWFYGHDAQPQPGNPPAGTPARDAREVRKLIARAFGAWLEAPDAVAEHAPGLYREFVDAVARNAKLSAAFDAIRRTALGEGSASRVYAEIEQSRTVAAETAAARLEDEARKPFGTKWERMKDSFVYNFDDMHGPIFMHIDRAQKRQLQELSASLKAGRITQADYNAVAGAFERAVKGLKIAQLTVDRGWQNEIRQYLWDMGRLFEEAKAAGVDPKNVQRYMDLRWIVSSGGRAGARGMSARDAQLVLDNMERQMGAEEFARLEGVAARFHAVREKNLLDDPRLVAMIGQDRVNYFKNNVHYVRTERLRATPEELARMETDRAQFRRDNPGDDDVTAAMLKLLAKTGGRGGGAGNSTWGHALEGSTRDIGDRFAATWRNDTRLIAAVERNDFVLQMRDALLAAKTPGVRDLPGSKGVQYPQNERYGHIRYFDGGQARVLVVPRVLADGYRQVSDGMNGWSAWGKIVHGVFIDWNLAYTLRNMTRNMASNESNIVGMRADNLTIAGNAAFPGAGRLASMASYQIARHLPERVFNNPLTRVIYGEHVNAAYARQAQRILELYLDPKRAVERQAQADEARLRGDAGPAAELQADLDMLRFVTKGNALIARWSQVRGQGRDADDFMRSQGLGPVYGEIAPQSPMSRAHKILTGTGKVLSYPFRRNARFNRELELHAKITAALAIHDRQPGLSAQEVGVEVARRASIPQSERHGAQAKFINYAWNMFYNTALKGGQRFVGNVVRNPRLLGKMAAQSLGPQLFWATMIAGGGLATVIRNMFGGGDDAEEKAREAGLGGLLDYAQFMHDGSFAASPYLQRFYHWCPLWQVSGGRYLGIATPRTDEEKMLLPFIDWAAKYLAPQPTDPTATLADAAKRATVGTFLPDMTARTPLVAAAQDLVFAWFQNPMDTYRGSRVYDNDLFQARFESGADAAAFFGATLKQGLNDLGGRSLLASKRNEIDAAGAQPPTWGERMLHEIPGLSGILAGTLRMTLTKEQRMDQIEKEQLRPIRAVKNLRSQDLMRMMLEDPIGNSGNETPEMKEKLDAWAAKYGWDQDERDNVFARAFNGYQAATAEGQALAERKKQTGRRKRWAKLPESERKAMEAAGLREIEAE